MDKVRNFLDYLGMRVMRPELVQMRRWILQTPRNISQDLVLEMGGLDTASPLYNASHKSHPFYALHYVTRGKGMLEYRQRTHAISADCLFVLFQHTPSHYWADPAHPWELIWISFHGRKARALLHQAGFSAARPFLYPEQAKPARTHLFELHLLGMMRRASVSCKMLGKLWDTFGVLADQPRIQQPSSTKESVTGHDKIVQITRFLTDHFAEALTIHQLSRQFGISPHHLIKLFRHHVGQSPIDFLIDQRIRAAKEHLVLGTDSIAQIAAKVSYADAAYFSRLFKRRTGLSPLQFRGRACS